ncbi:MAG: hypothetical protein KA369_05760 [Spirochaetes bacterium]|nr:hypothetical protein [Spirochaetota bacterium]
MNKESERLTELLDSIYGMQMFIDERLSNGFITIEEAKQSRYCIRYLADKLFSLDIKP